MNLSVYRFPYCFFSQCIDFLTVYPPSVSISLLFVPPVYQFPYCLSPPQRDSQLLHNIYIIIRIIMDKPCLVDVRTQREALQIIWLEILRVCRPFGYKFWNFVPPAVGELIWFFTLYNTTISLFYRQKYSAYDLSGFYKIGPYWFFTINIQL
jgi:hypothetical protein